MKLKKEEGFTLIELLVVVAIIGLLSSVVLASLSSARAKSRDTAIKKQLVEFRSATELAYANTGSYDNICNISSNSGLIFKGAAEQSKKVDYESICSSSAGGILYTLGGAVVSGGKPVTPNKWGASVRLVNNTNYFCTDYTGVAREQSSIGIYFTAEGTTDTDC